MCFVIGGFEFTVGLIGRIRLVVESAVGEGTAEALVEEQEQERDVNSFRGQPVGVASSIAFQQTVAFEFTEVVAKLVESILFRGSWKVAMTASWICLEVQPPTVLPLCSGTSSRRMIRVSWILMPG